MGKTSIEWTDVTWNPVRGCSRVSEGCRNCYAERQAYRFSNPSGRGRMSPTPFQGFVQMTNGHPQWTGKVQLVEEHLNDPLRWKKPKRVFVNSMSDLFHERLPDEAIDRVFAVMAQCPQHTFQILTKRPERMRLYLQENYGHQARRRIQDILAPTGNRTSEAANKLFNNWPLRNVWLGVSVEDQKTADERIPLLMETPAAIRFVSYEPALGPVDFGGFLKFGPRGAKFDRLDWIIVGGESGPGARMMQPDWARGARNQCQSAGVAFLFKQWGAWLPREQSGIGFYAIPHLDEDRKVGKRSAGRLLDGRTWDEFPELPAQELIA